MPLKTPAWGKLSTISYSRSEAKLDDQPSYLLSQDHGLYDLGLCRACSQLDWQSFSHWDGYVLKKNVWNILTTRWRCRFCAFIAQTIQGTHQKSFKEIIIDLCSIRSYKTPLLLTLRGNRMDVLAVRLVLHDFWSSSPDLLGSFDLYCELGTDPRPLQSFTERCQRLDSDKVGAFTSSERSKARFEEGPSRRLVAM